PVVVAAGGGGVAADGGVVFILRERERWIVDTSSNINVNKVVKDAEVANSVEDDSVDDLNDLNENLNNLGHDFMDMENLENAFPVQPDTLIKEENFVQHEIQKEEEVCNVHKPNIVDDTSDVSKPPSFEHFKRSPSHSSKCSTSFARRHKKDIKGVSLIHELKRIIEVGNALGYDVRGCRKSFNRMINGNFNFDYACSMARGRSGGLISMCDPNTFSKEEIWCDDSFIIVKGHWKNAVGICFMINVYGPQDPHTKSALWNKLADFMHNHNGKFILFGDLNVVRNEQERFGSIFSSYDANHLNAFIDSSGLIDLSIGGCYYTWMNKAGTKLSKLDRFLISDDILEAIPDIRITALDRLWSDHTPILFHVKKSNFGPSPFKLYNSWLLRDGFNDPIRSAWSSMENQSNDRSLMSHEKLRSIKGSIKQWHINIKINDRNKRLEALNDLKVIDKKIDDGSANENDRENRIKLLQDIDNLDNLEAHDLIQKAHIKWDIEGDENSKLFHGIINQKKRSQSITEEVKIIVWDCGNNKAPGPDGFSFAIVKKYWDLLKKDIFEFVDSFLASGTMPQGSNFSFFTLIPKVFPVNYGINKIGSSDITLSYLFYADDVIITIDWNSGDLDNIIRVLHVFYLASGCASGIFPFTYLGLPIGSNMNLVSSWQFLIDRFHTKLSSWKANLLSIGGCLTLIKAITTHNFPLYLLRLNFPVQGVTKVILRSLGIYFLSIFKARETVLKYLERYRAKYFWGGSQDSRKLAWIKWSNVLSSFDKEGLNIGSLKAFNLALLQKWRWRAASSMSREDIGVKNKAYLRELVLEISLVDIIMEEDLCVWDMAIDGIFLVGDNRRLIDAKILPTLVPLTSWDKTLPRKVNIFIWRLALDRLPHRLNLSARGMDIASIACPSYNDNVEASSHIFFDCDFAKEIWRLISSWCDFPLPTFTSYGYWMFRNSVIFCPQPLRKSDMFDNIHSSSFSWLSYRGRIPYYYIPGVKTGGSASMGGDFSLVSIGKSFFIPFDVLVIVTTSRYVVPTGRLKVPAGRYVVPAGKDNVIVSTGRTKVIPAGRTILVLLVSAKDMREIS
ncbi:RNA-directed DNA polymerase, eukaryota, reverse transcriptase zinc-binding domain protein, partial [Tanacetum coccineum]